MSGAYAILFKGSVIEEIIEELEKEETLVDHHYMRLQKRLNWYRTIKNIVYHPAGYSTIQEKIVDYPELYR